MQIAILSISSLSLIVSLGTFAIMAKTAHDLKQTKTEVETEIEVVKSKVAHNSKVIKTALSGLEL